MKVSLNASKLSEHLPDRGGKCENGWVGSNFFMAFNRVIFPDGSNIIIGSAVI